MKDERKTKEQLVNELAELRQRITESEASETERKRAEETLSASETRYRRLFETAQDGILILDAETGMIVDVNPFLTEMLGFSHKVFLGKKVWELGFFKDIAANEAYFAELQQKEYVRYEDMPLETAHGQQIEVEFVSNVYLVDHKKVIQCNIRDVTERKWAEEALKEYSERLEEMVEERTQELREAQEQLIRQEKLAVLGQLAGGVGHELRNPLGAIKNAAYFLNMALEEPEPEVKETLEILEKEVATSERVISSLLDFARAKPPVRRKVDVNELVQEALSRTAAPANIEVVRQLDQTLPTILADPDQLAQVFGNLIRNGIQAMPPLSSPPHAGGKQGGQLVVKSYLEGPEWVAVSITDTGVGIPEENLDKLFEPLFTTKARGIGLGLALVKTLVEGHGGSIEVESEVGKGSTFTVRLPISDCGIWTNPQSAL